MALKLFNTLARSVQEFAPLDPQKKSVGMYCCGPTVYDFAHIGNARPIIVFDLLFRLLRHVYGNAAVTYVRNITDVDDKINARAARDYPGLAHNEAIREVTRKTEEQFHADIRAPLLYLPEYLRDAPMRVLRAWWHVRRRPGYRAAWSVWWRDLLRDRTANRVRRFGQALVLAHELPADIVRLHAHFLHTPASVVRYAALMRALPWSGSGSRRS